MKRLAMAVVASSFLLASCGTAEWKVEQELGDEAFEQGDFESALSHYEASLEMKEMNQTKEKVQAASEQLKKLEAEEEKKQKEIAKEKKKKEEENKQRKAEAEKLLYPYIEELIETSEGMVKDIGPGSDGNWMTTFVIFDTNWHSLNQQEKEYIANTLAPAIEQGIISTGITSECFVHFYDTNDVHLVEPKGFSGYKVKH